jgi:hypothetical protein
VSYTNVSEEYVASIFRVKDYCWLLCMGVNFSLPFKRENKD